MPQFPSGAATALDASPTVKGITKITPAPAADPIAVGSNHPALTDARVPTAHTQTSTTISDFTEAVQDAVATLLGAGSNITLNYNDVTDSLTIEATDTNTTDPEAIRDAIGIALIGVGVVSVGVNDGADTITISTTATANATDAQLRDRTLHTGVQAIATVTGLQTALNALVSGPASAVSGNLATFSGTTGKILQDAGAPTSLTVAGDVTGTLAAAAVAKVRGKSVPTPGASEDGKGWYYDHTTAAFIFGISPQAQAALDAKLDASQKGVASGVASLTSGSRVVQSPKLHAVEHQLAGTDALDLPQYDLDLMLPGVIAPMAPWMSSVAANASAGRVYYGRFVVSRTMTIVTIGFVVTVADTADSAVYVGLADSAFNRLATSGSVTGKLNSTGSKTVNFMSSVVLSPRTVYHAAWLVPTVTTSVQVVFATTSNVSVLSLFGGPPNRVASTLDTQTAIPATAAPVAGTSGSACILMAVRES